MKTLVKTARDNYFVETTEVQIVRKTKSRRESGNFFTKVGGAYG
jgi:hypothetical protein